MPGMKTCCLKSLVLLSFAFTAACGAEVRQIVSELMPEVTITWPAKMFDDGVPKPKHVAASTELETGYQAGQPTLVGPHAADVDQGANGDCWLDATLASLAQHRPEAIISSISDTSLADTWQVRLYDPTNRFAPISFMVKKADFWGNPYASRDDTGALWPMILESAFVQLNDRTHYFGPGKGYLGLNGGIPNRAFEALVGQQAHNLWPAAADSRAFATALGNPHVPSVACTKDPAPTQLLVGGHCYTVISGDAKANKYVVRNPWGRGTDRRGDGLSVLDLSGMMRDFAFFAYVD